MLKKNHFITFLIFFLFFNGTYVFSYTIPEVRIGLEYKYKNTSSIPIQNTEITIGYESGGYFTPCAQLSQGSFTALATDDYFVRLPNQFYNYEQASQYLLNYSAYNSVVGLRNPGEFYVYLGGYYTQQEAQNTAAYTGGAIVNLSLRGTLISANGRAIILFDNDTLYPQIKSVNTGGFINLGDRQYRGIIELNRASQVSGKLTAVNVCSIDEYLYSVVPSEMYSSWPMEALKAQAVASRSYALTRLHAHNNNGYNFCDSGHCQVYLGADAEKEQPVKAVSETSGILIMHNGEPINAVFFSSSGGQTDNSENVWNDSIPYLRSVNDSTEQGFKTWSRTFSLTEITNILIAKNISIGNAIGVTIKSSPESGRVSELTIQGEYSSVSYEKEEVRTFFSSTAGGSLESKNFTITDGIVSAGASALTETSNTVVHVVGSAYTRDTRLTDAFVYSNSMATFLQTENVSIISKNGITQLPSQTRSSTTVSTGYATQVTFSGRGSGHGVGMSQYGAKSLAELGYSYLDILRHYYTGVYFSNDIY